MRRSRASSDPGTPLSGREDLELQPMDTQVEASVQNAVEETAATNPPEIVAPPSTEPLQTIAILDPRTPHPTRTTTTPEQEKLVHSDVGTSTSARPSAEETATPGQQGTLTRIILSSESSLVSGQSGSHQTYFPSQENCTPGLEDITRLSTEVTLMRPLAETPLVSTEQHNTPGQEHSIDLPLESSPMDPSAEPRIQPSTPQDAPSGRADLAGAASPVTPQAEPETSASARKTGAPDLEAFFEKYKSIVQPSEFDEFRSTLSRKRNFRAFRFLHKYSGDDENMAALVLGWTPVVPRIMPQTSKKPWPGTLLIEDADIECILALDAEYGLDPRFIAGYVGRSHSLDPWDDCFRHSSCFNDASMVGNWYIMDADTLGAFSRRWHDPSRTARRGIPKFFDRGKATNGKRPWWGEACRQHCAVFPGVEEFFVDSKIACYCLSDDLRKLRL
jgi:hypothetical protein